MDADVKVGLALAKKFKERSETLGYKGKKRDDALMDYWCGAVVLAIEQDPKGSLANYLGMIGAMLFATRGYAELLRYIEKNEALEAA